MPTIPFTWLSDLTPAYAAQETWLRGDYLQRAVWHVAGPTDGGPFAVACGAALLARHVRRFRFTPDVIERIGRDTDERGHSRFGESFLNHLQRMRLRIDVWAAHEGAVLLPGEPVAVVAGPLLQVQLLESAFHWLLGQSTRWATEAARDRWASGDLHETQAPVVAPFDYGPDEWRRRARFIGGATDLTSPADEHANLDRFIVPASAPDGAPLHQIRRLFDGARPLGDLWLTAEQEAATSVTQSHVEFTDQRTAQPVRIDMTRFQNLYHPLVVQGHAVWEEVHPEYARQRTLQHLAAFNEVGLADYPLGWRREMGL